MSIDLLKEKVLEAAKQAHLSYLKLHLYACGPAMDIDNAVVALMEAEKKELVRGHASAPLMHDLLDLYVDTGRLSFKERDALVKWAYSSGIKGTLSQLMEALELKVQEIEHLAGRKKL